MAVRAREMIEYEQTKGCQELLAAQPVALEPPYQPIAGLAGPATLYSPAPWTCEPPTSAGELLRFDVWLDPNQKCDWNRSERWLKYLCSAQHRIGLEIVGNRQEINIQILCHRQDAPIVETTFMGEFALCRLTRRIAGAFAKPAESQLDCQAICDFYPPPPYSHLLTPPDELRSTPYSAIATALSFIEPPGLGIYQVLFQVVAPDHDWHANVQTLFNLEYAIKLVTGMPTPQRSAQQVPSGELHDMSDAVLTKAHSDKPFFAVAARVGIFASDNPQVHLGALAAFSNLIQSGGRPLKRIGTAEYAQHLDPCQARRIFAEGLTFRAGFLANSRELASLVHIPPAQITDRKDLAMRALETLPPNDELHVGTPLGYCECAGELLPVCVPYVMRQKHVHVLGRTGTGKSTVMESMVLDDIDQGEGVAVLDPHGELVHRLLHLIPRKHMERVIWADAGDPEHVLLWNPLTPPARQVAPGLDRGRMADDIVTAFKSFVDGWGDRLEHLLRYSVAAIMKLPDGTLRDVADLLRRESEASQVLRQRILSVLHDPFERQFWIEDFPTYHRSDIHPPQHKLSKLLASEPVRRMLSQPQSAFGLRELMDNGNILLVNLSTVGSETRQILGCFVLSLLHLAALSRADLVGTQRRFHIYCDEAHRFLTDAMEDLIAETRKFKVSLTLAHQNLKQFSDRKIGAMASVGTTVIFDVDGNDAQYLLKDLLGKVQVEDLAGQLVGHAVARIGQNIVRLQTPDRRPIPVDNCAKEILHNSRRRYYRPAAEFVPIAPLAQEPNTTGMQDKTGRFEYDVLT
jgi:hypothetical protein